MSGRGRGGPPRGPSANNRGFNSRGGTPRSRGTRNAQGGEGNATSSTNAGRSSPAPIRGQRGRRGNNPLREKDRRNRRSGSEYSPNEESEDDDSSPPPDDTTAPLTDGAEPEVVLRIKERPADHDYKRRFQYLQERQPLIKAAHIKNREINPDHNIPLSESVPYRGLCEDNCPEFERVRRIVENDMKLPEFTAETARGPREKRIPDESRMVKAWKRSVPGTPKVLPSLVRTPEACLRSTVYLIQRTDEDGLEFTYSWIWDRTRAIKNDLDFEYPSRDSTTPVYLRIHEMIVRWHLMAAHGMSLSGDMEFSHMQEMEQIKATYISLGIRYEEARAARIPTPQEEEVLAYAIIITIDPKRSPNPGPWGPSPSAMDRIRNLPNLKTAFKIVDAANAIKEKAAKMSVYKERWKAFWDLIASEEVTYLMACAAEIGFNLVRYHILSVLYRIYTKHGDTADMRTSRLVELMGFDNEAQVRSFCRICEVTEVKQDSEGEVYIDFDSINKDKLLLGDNMETVLPCDFSDKPQFYSERLVEAKRPPNQSWLEITAGPDPDPTSLFIPEPPRHMAKSPFSKEVLAQLPPIPPPDTNPFEKSRLAQQATSSTTPRSPFAAAAAATATPANPFTKAAATQAASSATPFSPFGQPTASSPFGKPAGAQVLPPANGSPFGQPTVTQAELPKPSPFAKASMSTVSNGNGVNQSSPFAKPPSGSPFASPQGVTPGVWDASKPINFAPQNGVTGPATSTTPPPFGLSASTQPVTTAHSSTTSSSSPFQLAGNGASESATSPPAQTGPSEEDLQRQKKEEEEREKKRKEDLQKQQEAEHLARQEAERQQAIARQQEQERQLALARQKAKEDLERRKELERQQELARLKAIEQQRQLERERARQHALERGKNTFAMSIVVEGDKKNSPLIQQFVRSRLENLFPVVAYQVTFAKAEAIANERFEQKRLEKLRSFMGMWYGKTAQAAHRRRTRAKASARRKWLKEHKEELDAANEKMGVWNVENRPPGIFDISAAPASSTTSKRPVSKDKKTKPATAARKTKTANSNEAHPSNDNGAVQSINGAEPIDDARHSLDSPKPLKSVADFVWGTPYKNPNPPMDRTNSEYFERKIAALRAKKPIKRTRDTEERSSTPGHKRSRTSSTPIRAPQTPLPQPDTESTEDEHIRRFRELQAKLNKSSPRASPKTTTASPKTINASPSVAPTVQHEFSRSVPTLTTLPTRPAYHDRVSRFVPRHLYGKGADAVRKYYQASKGSSTTSPEVPAASSPIPTQQSYIETQIESAAGSSGEYSGEGGFEDEESGDYESGEMEYEDEDEEGWEFAQQAGPGLSQDDAIELSD